MKKILLVSSKDNTFYNFRKELIIRLHEMGYEVVLVCPYGKKMDYFTERGCRFIDVDMDRRGTNIWNDLKLIIQYWNLFRVEKPDVILTYTAKPSIYGGFVSGILKIPYIVNNAGIMEATGLFDKFMNLLYIIGFRKASCIMFQNTYERDVVMGLLKNQVSYRDIPGSGVNVEEFSFKEYPANEDKIIFNYVARIVKIKGIDELLECVARIKPLYPNTEFVLYGDYDDDTYRLKVSELEKTGIVKYGGIQMDMKPYIERAHAVIHPSYYEGMTNVVLEHSAIGRPCIGSNIPGVKEGIEEGQTGFVFEVRNVDSMVEAVKRFIELPYDEKAQMGKNARAKMEMEFNRDIITNTYLEEICRIIGEQ